MSLEAPDNATVVREQISRKRDKPRSGRPRRRTVAERRDTNSQEAGSVIPTTAGGRRSPPQWGVARSARSAAKERK
jgi:hypothetical protein